MGLLRGHRGPRAGLVYVTAFMDRKWASPNSEWSIEVLNLATVVGSERSGERHDKALEPTCQLLPFCIAQPQHASVAMPASDVTCRRPAAFRTSLPWRCRQGMRPHGGLHPGPSNSAATSKPEASDGTRETTRLERRVVSRSCASGGYWMSLMTLNIGM